MDSQLQDIANLLKYIARVLEDGESVNKRPILLPIEVQPALEAVGAWLASLFYA